MSVQDIEPDPQPNTDQLKAIEKLSKQDTDAIDQMLLEQTGKEWRKIAIVVATVITDPQNNYAGIPDLYFAQRIRIMVEAGVLEAQGYLASMRYSEARRVS